MDSYRAPEDLAEARRRVEETVKNTVETTIQTNLAERCRRPGVDEVDRGTAVVELGARPSRSLPLPAESICVVSDLVLWRWDRASLQTLADGLAPDKVLVFLEPTADLGWRRMVHRVARPALELGLGHHFEADVPALLREAGLVVTTVDRFGLGPAELRSYVWGVAQHIAIGDPGPQDR